MPRARMLSYLQAGDYVSAGELARAASITPATVSGHLGKLLVCVQRGRHRYYKLADDEVAHPLKAVALIAEHRSQVAPTNYQIKLSKILKNVLYKVHLS